MCKSMIGIFCRLLVQRMVCKCYNSRRTDAPKKDIDIKSLIEDIDEARMIRDILFEKKQIYK